MNKITSAVAALALLGGQAQAIQVSSSQRLSAEQASEAGKEMSTSDLSSVYVQLILASAIKLETEKTQYITQKIGVTPGSTEALTIALPAGVVETLAAYYALKGVDQLTRTRNQRLIAAQGEHVLEIESKLDLSKNVISKFKSAAAKQTATPSELKMLDSAIELKGMLETELKSALENRSALYQAETALSRARRAYKYMGLGAIAGIVLIDSANMIGQISLGDASSDSAAPLSDSIARLDIQIQNAKSLIAAAHQK